jgi:hypothetical protein
MNQIDSMETEMLGRLHERQLKTLEQGINDIEMCAKQYRLYIIFIYENQIIRGGLTFMNDKYFIVKKKEYYFDKLNNIYSYFTLQKLSLNQIKEWYLMEEDEYSD